MLTVLTCPLVGLWCINSNSLCTKEIRHFHLPFCPMKTDGYNHRRNPIRSNGWCSIACVPWFPLLLLLVAWVAWWQCPCSHSPWGQLLLIHACQRLGSTLDHLSPGHACEGLVPVCPAHVGNVSLQDFTHRHQQARPAQAVVRGCQGLGLGETVVIFEKFLNVSRRNWYTPKSVKQVSDYLMMQSY